MTDTDLVEAVKQDAHAMNELLAGNWRRDNARRQIQAKANALGHSDHWVDEQMAALRPCVTCGYLCIGDEDCPRDHSAMVSQEGVW